eukprot:TRINITY_DN11720_c0_g1_i1.p1 TRINITY_DN11720_c0_g1~~TRINITY_DN11720_c0_g1_i1.p1  ORF type:complete len:388 (+),score=57.93 TRINITY_DN11720_c0_g1_i1:32-1165(+)
MAEYRLNIGSYSLGVLLLISVAVIWVAASQLIKVIFSEDFSKPFFVTYFNTVGFTLWLAGVPYVKSWSREMYSIDEKTGQLKWRTYLNLAMRFAPAWMTANYLFNLSLVYASVSSNSILSNTSSLWTMLLSIIFLKEPATCVGVIAVGITVAGAAFVALSDHHSSSDSSHHDHHHDDDQHDNKKARIGDILALSSALCYGGYTVFMKKVVPEQIVMPIFFGFVGILVFVCGIPVLFILNATGAETFSLPRSDNIGMLGANALLGTNLSDVLWARAVFLTSPTVATVGLSLTIPLGMLSDMVFHGDRFSVMYVGGAVLVLVGFLLINLKQQIARACPLSCCRWGIPLSPESPDEENGYSSSNENCTDQNEEVRLNDTS